MALEADPLDHLTPSVPLSDFGEGEGASSDSSALEGLMVLEEELL